MPGSRRCSSRGHDEVVQLLSDLGEEGIYAVGMVRHGHERESDRNPLVLLVVGEMAAEKLAALCEQISLIGTNRRCG